MNNRRLISCTSCNTPISFVPSGRLEGSEKPSTDGSAATGPLTQPSLTGAVTVRNPKPLATYFEPPAILTGLTIAGLLFIILIHIANVFRLIFALDIFDGVEAGQVTFAQFQAKADTFDGLGSIFQVAWIVSYLTTGVLFLLWLRRSSKNTRFLDVGRTVVSPGWAVALWLIPAVNFVAPYIVLRDLAAKVMHFSSHIRREALTVLWWGSIWAAVAVLAANSGFEDTIANWKKSTGYLFGGNLLLAVAALCAAVIVLQITAGSQKRADEVVSNWQEKVREDSG